ncbi:MAG: methionine--tRNA ligase [Oscillospiraceae bacterium]|nr:methionine--tRNA ligase [Oscillospiraceae bacterium]
MKILIGSAWPYANGSLHIGHLAALLPADVIARYYRLKGDSVYFVSGSDCHGTPVAILAKQEGKSPEEISRVYHDEFCECFEKLGFSFDRYGKTSSDEHKNFVKEFHKTMYESNYIYEKEAPQSFCEGCSTALSDRFVLGKCPVCGENARGDQCDACGTVLDPENLIEPICSICKDPIVFKKTNHLFIAISKMEDKLISYLKAHPNWRKNAISFTRRYIDEGLRDRAITRDLDWGIDVPKAGYEGKKIYIWAENVLGYLSMSKALAEERGENFFELWNDDSLHYYVHGKDNIPFHTIILPSLLIANGGDWKLPDVIVSSEFLTLEGRKISTSKNWAIWIKDIAERYDPDSIRYFLIANGPEKRDTDFTWREFVNSHNGELLGAYGNFVNRTLAFIYKYLDGIVPSGVISFEILQKIEGLYSCVGKLIEKGDLKEAIDNIFEFVRYGNKYFDTERPWETRQSNIIACENTIFSCVQMIANIALLLEPFLPFSSEKIKSLLRLNNLWKIQCVPSGFIIPEPEILFKRIDKKVIEEELLRLKHI